MSGGRKRTRAIPRVFSGYSSNKINAYKQTSSATRKKLQNEQPIDRDALMRLRDRRGRSNKEFQKLTKPVSKPITKKVSPKKVRKKRIGLLENLDEKFRNY